MFRKRVSIFAVLAAFCLIFVPDGASAQTSICLERTLGSWAEMQVKHFADGATYDQIVVKR